MQAAGLRARYLVAADGLHSSIRTSTGLGGADAASAPRWGLRRHYATSPWSDSVEVTWAQRSEAYVTPVAAGTIGIAILSSDRGGFDDQLAAFSDLRARLIDAPPISDVRGAGPLGPHVVPLAARAPRLFAFAVDQLAH